jgi:hypothetical protein
MKSFQRRSQRAWTQQARSFRRLAGRYASRKSEAALLRMEKGRFTVLPRDQRLLRREDFEAAVSAAPPVGFHPHFILTL